MKIAPLPVDETERIAELDRYRILDTLPESDFDDFTYLASTICDTPIALISLIDEKRQWFKSKVGLDADETPREVAFCSHAILQDETFIIPDSSLDERFHDNPLATDAPFVRFYAGAPLQAPSGHNLGTICVIDNQPRELSAAQIKALEAISRQIINQLEMRLSKINAEKAVRAKSLFLATMSHEIRTPLNGILGCSNILLDSMSKDSEIQLVKTITDCGDSLLCLINDVLDFSKLESGKMELEEKAFNLSRTVDEVIGLFAPTADEQGTTICSQYSEDLPKKIYGDPVRIRQILTNLLSNAIKFAPSGNVEIRVESLEAKLRKNASMHSIKISVIDDGIGIDKQNLKKLFQSFSQVDASTSRKFGGTGLGLSICKAIADLMGSEIWAESEDGNGSVFSFTLKTREATDEEFVSTSSVVDVDMGNKAPMKILVAEDNKVNQMIVQNLLDKFGYPTDVVSNGLQALDKLSKETFDLVFMDCFMPDMDGLEATKIIKREPEKYGNPRVIALTASALKEDRDLCFDAGMDDFLSKPLDTGAIVNALSESFVLKQANQ